MIRSGRNRASGEKRSFDRLRVRSGFSRELARPVSKRRYRGFQIERPMAQHNRNKNLNTQFGEYFIDRITFPVGYRSIDAHINGDFDGSVRKFV